MKFNNLIINNFYRQNIKMAEWRDDFTKKTIDILAKRAGSRCSICKATTYGPNDNPHLATNIGKAAHIAAASEGGPRYNPAMSTEMRKSLKNGIWLCANCHDNVDRNPLNYSINKLQTIKKEAEELAKKDLGVPTGTSNTETDDKSLVPTVSSIVIVEVRKVKASLPSSRGAKMTASKGMKILSAIEFIDFVRDPYLPEVGIEVLKLLSRFVTGYKHEPEVYLEVIRHVRDVVDILLHSWGEKEKAKEGDEEVESVCQLITGIMGDHNVRSSVYQSALALLKDVVRSSKKYKNGNVQWEFKKYFEKHIKDKLLIEEQDYAEPPDPKKRCVTEGGEVDPTIRQYLENMLKLGAPKDAKIDKDIEQEIVDLGFEPDIL